MMAGHAAPTGLPRRDQRLRVTAPAAREQSGQGRGDSGVTTPDHRPGAPTGRHSAAVLPRRPGVPRSTAAPASDQGASSFRLPVRPETVLRRHRDLLARRHVARSRPKRPGRPRTVRSIRLLVLRLARENPTWGYRRIHGQLLVLGIKVAASTVWQLLEEAGIDPAAKRTATTWSTFLRTQASALLACDFFETSTLSGTRLYVLAVIEHSSRRIRILGATAYPTALWVVQAAKNLVMDLEDEGRPAIPDPRPGREVPALFDTVLADAGIQVVLGGVRIPRMNAIMERRLQTCRHELLDRTLIRNQQTGHRSSRSHPPRRPQTAPAGRHPQRVPPRGLTCTDGIFDKHRVTPSPRSRGRRRAAPVDEPAAAPDPPSSSCPQHGNEELAGLVPRVRRQRVRCGGVARNARSLREDCGRVLPSWRSRTAIWCRNARISTSCLDHS